MEQLERLDGTLIPEADAERFRRFVNGHRWRFAKTYAAFCPHEYTLRKESTERDFFWFAEFVCRNGFEAWYGKNPAKYFIDWETGWYYFVLCGDIDEDGKIKKDSCGLINRANLREFEFIQEVNLFGVKYIVKRLPKEQRG